MRGKWLQIVNRHRCEYLEVGGHKNVTFALEEAMKFQRGRRYIDVLFL